MLLYVEFNIECVFNVYNTIHVTMSRFRPETFCVRTVNALKWKDRANAQPRLCIRWSYISTRVVICRFTRVGPVNT